ncbi:hypothetical protein PFICI_04224 [Pestalotiopsis fici W106-1]|uniref:Glycosyltransferase family 31 protein n=1 Tax=Pestalotiopsis fici (strain W106-1 / CGMCC3.15140) TaxID=1229662 RepID=W3X8A0_PESFW|nr:uncharacterized protein PFICI_04224 [Pestalotiopsis fici W106-1]ETS82348.1 hypothetical protein PFICI_04224 [Pestalotiopsis fici W106-1]
MFRPVYVSGRVRWLHFFVTFIIICVLLSAVRYHRPPPRPPSIYDYTDGKTAGTWLNETLNEVLVTDEASYLKDLVSQYGLSEDMAWYARRLRTSYKSNVRNSMTDTGLKFMARDFQRVRPEEERLHLHAEKAIHLAMQRSPTPDNLDVSSLIFGISSSYGRLTYADDALLRDWARWLTDGKGRTNGASLVLTLHRATNAEVSYLSAKLRELGIDAVVLAANENSDVTSRYIELMHMISRRKDELSREGETKSFLALVDDDVFFPSLGKLLGRLAKFSSSEKVYLGMPSERADWTVENNITLTYGGGAVFFNNRMANDLGQLPCLQESDSSLEGELKPRGDAYWDEHIYKCISQHTDEDMHVLPSFYVPEDDYHGLRTGFEGGVQPLALHHYKHRHRFEAWKAHMVAGLCGEDCFLQRFFFRDSWILVNGHTISHYPDGVEVVPMPRTSRLVTQQGRDKEREVKTAARIVIEPVEGGGVKQRKVVSWTGVKRTWRLLDARMGEDGEVWQAYVKRRGSPMSYGDENDWMPDDTVHSQDSSSDEDSMIMLIWEP